MKLATSNLVHKLGLGLAYQKRRFEPKLAGVWARGASKKFLGPPTYFLQSLKLATSNVVHTLGLGLAYQKQRFGPKWAGVWARGASKKIWCFLCIFATVKFGTQIGFGTSLSKQRRLGPKLAGMWARGSSRKHLGPPSYIFATVEASNFKFDTQLGFGTSLPKNNVLTIIGGGVGQGSIPKN